jgi:hypothetical protein
VPLTTVTSLGITFSYPKGWSETGWYGFGTMSEAVDTVGNQAFKTSCNHSQTCDQPVDQMQPSTLIVEWWNNGFPGWSFAAQPGTPTTVDGSPAKRQDSADLGVCSGLSADSALQVIIQPPGTPTDDWYSFVACFKGPGVAAEKSEALDILASARIRD